MLSITSPDAPAGPAVATRSRLRLLTRHFFRRFFENDLIAPSGDGHIGLSHLLAAFVTPGFLVVILVLLKYALVYTTWQRVIELGVDDALLYVALSMIVLGIAATVTWDAFFLDARDHFVLGVLPVGHRLVALAKLGALAMFLAVFATAANLVPTLLVPSLMLQRAYDATLFGHFVPLTAAHGAATILSGTWMVLAVVALRGAMAACLPGGWLRRLAPIAQVAEGGWWRDASPPLWFLGLYETIVGQPQPVYHALARTACWATAAVAAAVVALVFALPARRQSELAASVAGPWRGRNGTALLNRFGGVLLARSRARASFRFSVAGLGRSANHRVYLAAAVGAGLAWSFSAVFWLFGRSGMAGLHLPGVETLAVQPTIILFLVVAIRFAITIPLALPANWIFRVTESRTVADDHAGIRAVATVVGLLVVASLVPLHATLWSWDVAAYHALAGVLYVIVIVALFFGAQTKYPFAAPYVSGSIKLKSRWLLYLFGLWALTGLPAYLELQVFRFGRRAILLPVGAAVVTWILVRWRRRREAELPGLEFDEVPDDVPQSLDLFM
jgi:hypothetical protein